MKPASSPRFFILFFTGKGYKEEQEHHSFLPQKKQRKSCLPFPLSFIRVKLIRLLKSCFPEQLQLRACNSGDTVKQVGMRLFLHVDLKNLWVHLHISSSNQQLQLTPSPSGKFHRSWQRSLYFQLQMPLVAVWCWLHKRRCLELNCGRSQAMSMFDTCIPKTGYLQAKLETREQRQWGYSHSSLDLTLNCSCISADTALHWTMLAGSLRWLWSRYICAVFHCKDSYGL